MKNTGIWIDKDKAFIVTLENNVEALHTITSNVEHYRTHGGSGTRFKGGPQDVVQDSKYLNREKQQLKKYYKSLASEIKNTDALVIFGPADTSKKFSEELQNNYKSLSTKIMAVKKTDSMTENQIKALVRDFYRSN